MPHEIRYVPLALGHLRDFSARERAMILDEVDGQLRHQPDIPTRQRKRMRPNPLATWELRIGDLRVYYDVEPATGETTESKVIILAIGRKRGNQIWIGGEEYKL